MTSVALYRLVWPKSLLICFLKQHAHSVNVESDYINGNLNHNIVIEMYTLCFLLFVRNQVHDIEPDVLVRYGLLHVFV